MGRLSFFIRQKISVFAAKRATHFVTTRSSRESFAFGTGTRNCAYPCVLTYRPHPCDHIHLALLRLLKSRILPQFQKNRRLPYGKAISQKSGTV